MQNAESGMLKWRRVRTWRDGMGCKILHSPFSILKSMGQVKKGRDLADFQGTSPYCRGFSRVFRRPTRERARIPSLSHFAKERVVNKAELIAALAMRTKMSKADAGRAIESLFDDKGIIAGELKKGAKVQITGFGNFEARKRAARMGRNPKTGAEIQIKATVAPAFRAGKQLKMAVNKK